MSAIPPTVAEELTTTLQNLALKTTRNAAMLPSDIAFHRSLDRDFAKEIDSCSSKILSLANRLLALVDSGDTNERRRAKRRRLQNDDDVLDDFHPIVVDAMDQLLERTDECLDEMKGLSKPAIAVNPKKTLTPKVTAGKPEQVVQHVAHLAKPQLKFAKRTRLALKHKYNAKVPLGHVYLDESEMATDADETASFHPYHYEITNITYPPRMYLRAPPREPRSFEDTPFTWVATKGEYETMLEKLRHSSELAIDLEHHDYRTFAGFVCLMQISTREEDFVVDTFELREELETLNEVFTNPKIIKVFHGAESDIIWLQQDFNLYVVNLFDTYHASKVLGFSKHGLGTLLEMYCDFAADKRYQLADWRVRPLTPHMLLYARSDTHFLLYIYDHLRNALLDRANDGHELVDEVLARSHLTSLRVYDPEVYDYEGGSGSFGWDTLMRKWNKGLFGMQLEVYKAVHAWRDEIARQEDESIRYVLPNQYLFKLTEQPPVDIVALLALFQGVPPVVRKRTNELLNVIQDTIKAHAAMTKQTKVLPAEQTSIPPSSEAVTALELSATENLTTQVPSMDLPLSLWGTTSLDMISVSSTLLDSSNLSSRPLPTATSSVLLGVTRPGKRKRSAFEEVVSRIHGTLLVAPQFPEAALSKATLEVTPTTAVEHSSAVPPDQEEIGFVPASQRHTIVLRKDEAVVMVGQRQRRNKRQRPARDDDSTNDETPVNREADSVQMKKAVLPTEDELVRFDYTTAPNILDDMPEPTNERKRKAKKQKKERGGVIEYGNFPAPPKAHSELKRGNQSHTFR